MYRLKCARRRRINRNEQEGAIMKKTISTLLVGTALLVSAGAANAWWGSWFPWSGGPWNGWGAPWYGGYYPYYGYPAWGYPAYGAYPAWGYPYYGYGAYPWVAPVAPVAPATSTESSE